MSARLCCCMEGWLLAWRLWPGGQVLTLAPQEQWPLLPPSQGIIFVLPFFTGFGSSTATTHILPRVGWADGWFAGGQEQPEQCLWGGSVAPQRCLLLLHLVDVTPRPKTRRWFGRSWGRLGKKVLRENGLGH